MCFVWIWEQTAIISLYSINWLVFISETECVYCAVRTGYLNLISVICFIWIWEQTAIISLHNFNWLVYITKESVYCAVRAENWDIIQVNPSLNRAVQCLSRLFAGLSPRRPVFSSQPINVTHTVDNVGLGQLFFPFQYFTTNAPQSSSSSCRS